jgi:Protein of unknown function (DUF2442)
MPFWVKANLQWKGRKWRVAYPPFVCEQQTHEVQAVIPLHDYRLAVRFSDGISGIVDMKTRIEGPDAGVFAPLRDPMIFNVVKIESGTVTWPNGCDLAPAAMHAELAAHGEWRLV